jgi:exosortase
LTLLLASGAGVAAMLAVFWGANSDYADRFIILAATGWLFWTARSRLPEARLFAGGLLPAAIGAAAAAPAYYLAVQVGPRSILLWWLAAAWVVSAIGFLAVAGGWRWVWRLRFPLVFLFLALPIPERIEVPLQERLQSMTTVIAEWGLWSLGMDVKRVGFELCLPGGVLEVVEACSGVRSITALVAIAVFVSHLRGFGLARGLVMLALAIPIIAAVNALRIILTGLIQEGFGSEWIKGTPHELLGTAMVLVGLALVVSLSYLMRSRRPGRFPRWPP